MGANDEPALSGGREPGRSFAIALALITVVAYLPTFGAYFVADDFDLVTHAPWESVFWHLDKGAFYRPLPALAMWSEGAVWGLWPLPMRVSRWALHLACALLCGVLAGRLVPRRGAREAAALLFAVHPVHVGAVAWLAGIFDLFFTLFALVCVWAYDSYRVAGGRGRYVVALLALVGALVSKEHAVSVAPLLVIWALARFGWTRVATVVPFVAITAGYVAIRFHFGVEGPSSGKGVGILPEGVGEVLRGVIVAPLEILVAPIGEATFGSWTGAVRGAFVLAAVVVVGFGIRSDARWTAKALAVGAVALVATTLPVASRILEGMGPGMGRTRFLYLPSIVPCVLAGAIVAGSSTARRRVIVVPIALLFALGTHVNARAWRAAGDVSRSVVEGIEARFPTFGVDDPVLLVESMPWTHGGIITLDENGLEKGLRARRPEFGALEVIAPSALGAWPRDVREVVDPERSFAVRWDRQERVVEDRTDRMREVMARLEEGRGSDAPFDEMDLGDWRLAGEGIEGAPVVFAVDGVVRLECDVVPVRTRRLVLHAVVRAVGEGGGDAVAVEARWWTGEREGYRGSVRVPCRGRAGHHAVGTYLLEIDELDAEGMSVVLELRGEGVEVELIGVLVAY